MWPRYDSILFRDIRDVRDYVPPSWTIHVARACMIFPSFLIMAAMIGMAREVLFSHQVIFEFSAFLFVLGTCYWAAHWPQAEEKPKEVVHLTEMPIVGSRVTRLPKPRPMPLGLSAGGAHKLSVNQQALPRNARSRVWQEGFDAGFIAGTNKAIVELTEEED